ncbi:MAG: protein kinase domain-containing protein [Planctomycetota bacterium]
MSALPLEVYLMRFFDEFERDRKSGALRPVEYYQARFPHCARELADEYAALTGTPVEGVAGRQLAGYELLRQVGSGGTSIVYSALTPARDRLVALKVLKAALEERRVRRFAREADIVQMLEHDGIARVYGHGEHDGVHFLAMEWIDGASLADREKPAVVPDAVGVRQVCRIAVSILRALAAAHDQGVVHRDVKPANVMVDERGRVVLIDFGFAAVCDEADNSLSRTADVVGTPYYMAPEQFDGRTMDAAVDIWATGVLLFELLAGQRPFEGPSPDAIRAAIRSSEPPDLRALNPVVGPELAACVDMALSKQGARRYASAAQFADDLDRVMAGEPVQARHVGPVTRWVRAARRRPYAVGGVGLVALLLLLATVLSFEAARSWRAQAESSAQLADVAVTLAHVLNGAARHDAQAAADERGLANGYRQDVQLRASLDDTNERLQRLAAESPNDEDLAYADSLVADALGLIQFTLGEHRLARPLFARAIARNDELLEQRPDDVLYRSNRMRAMLRAALTERQLEQRQATIELLEQVDRDAQLARLQLGLAWAVDQGDVFNGVANLYRDLGLYERAYQRFRDCDELLEPLEDADRSATRDWVARNYLCYECAQRCSPPKEEQAARHRKQLQKSLAHWDGLPARVGTEVVTDPLVEQVRAAMGW